jgi:hypothetical protein
MTRTTKVRFMSAPLHFRSCLASYYASDAAEVHVNLTDFSPDGSRTRTPGGLTNPAPQVGVAVGLALTIGFSLVHFLLDWAFSDDRRRTGHHSPHSGFGAEIPVMPDRVTIEGSAKRWRRSTPLTWSRTPGSRSTGNQAHLFALVEAQHVTKASPHRHLLLKNIYDVALPVRMPAGSSS